MYNLHLDFEQKDLAPQVLSGVVANQTILEVLLEKGVELHHNCGAVCACTTCHIYVEKGSEHITEATDKEEDYIDRAINPTIQSRLACQCMLLEGQGDIHIRIPDQTQFLGE